MKIAIQDSFPNAPISAEKRFIKRAIEALRRLGHKAVGVETSDEIMAFAPDLLLVTHELTPKLVDLPTVGLIWNPPSFLMNENPYVQRNLLSYDGYYSASPSISLFLNDLLFSARKDAPVAEFIYPSCFDTPFEPRPLDNFSLFYAGGAWDQGRFRRLFEILDGAAPLKVYGPPGGWEYLRRSYAGPIPVEGGSVRDKIRECGVALCLHRPEHRDAHVPTTRIFESAAAGAVILADDFPFTRDHFGEGALFLDSAAAPEKVAEQILGKLKWIAENPGQAMGLAERGHAVFSEKFCLEKVFSGIESFAEEVRRKSFYPSAELAQSALPGAQPVVEYIIRAGYRPVSFLRRALDALAKQTYNNIGVIIVRVGDFQGLEEVAEEYRPLFKSVRILDVEGPLPALRSTALWTGMRAVSAPLFGCLDDDDGLHMNHVASLVDTLRKNPDLLVAYSGAIRVEEEDGFYFMEPNFQVGPEDRLIKERRRLQLMSAFERHSIMDTTYMLTNAWIAKTEILDERILTDPLLSVVEDMYLNCCFSMKSAFAPTWRPSAVWNWRSASNDNVTGKRELHQAPHQRMKNRLAIDMGRSSLQRLRPGLERDLTFYRVESPSGEITTLYAPARSHWHNARQELLDLLRAYLDDPSGLWKLPYRATKIMLPKRVKLAVKRLFRIPPEAKFAGSVLERIGLRRDPRSAS